MRLKCERWGDPAQQNRVTLLHGMGGTGKLWRPVAASLERNFQILAPDQRAHGDSRPATPASFRPIDFGQDVAETLDSESFSPTWLVGHSMGVRTACAAYSLVPDKILGMVLIDLGLSGPAGGGLGQELADLLGNLPPSFPSRNEARAWLDKRSPDPSITQYLMAVGIKEKTSEEFSFPFDSADLVRTIEASKDSSIREWIESAGKNQTPVWLLRGAESRVWKAADFQNEKDYFAAYPSIKFVEFAGTGHGLPFEKRKEFVKFLIDSLTSPA